MTKTVWVVSFCVAWLALCGTAVAPGAEVDYTKYDKSWLNPESWPALVAERQVEATDKDDAETKLLKERSNAANQELRERYNYWLQNHESLSQLYQAVKRAVKARLELEGAKADKVAILKEQVAFAKAVEQQVPALYTQFRRVGVTSDKAYAKYFRADAELELLRAEKAAKKDKGK